MCLEGAKIILRYYHNCKFLNFFTPARHQFRRLLIIANFVDWAKYTRHGGHATLGRVRGPPLALRVPHVSRVHVDSAHPFVSRRHYSQCILLNGVPFYELWICSSHLPQIVLSVALVWQTELLCQWWIHTVKQVLYNITSSGFKRKNFRACGFKFCNTSFKLSTVACDVSYSVIVKAMFIKHKFQRLQCCKW